MARARKLNRLVLGKRPNDDSTIVLFPKANHTLLESETRNDRDIRHLKKYVPGVFEIMTDWLKERVPRK